MQGKRELGEEERQGRATIALSKRTKEVLDEMRHPSQSYDGVIRGLVDFWKKAHPLKEAPPPGKEGGKSGNADLIPDSLYLDAYI